jgi:hypothetical protein
MSITRSGRRRGTSALLKLFESSLSRDQLDLMHANARRVHEGV